MGSMTVFLPRRQDGISTASHYRWDGRLRSY